jgi:hypothetical protein
MNPRMIKNRLALAVALTLTALLAMPALAVPPAPESLRSMPGYMDLDWVHIPDGAAEIQDVVLDPVLAGLAAKGISEDDEAMTKALSMVKSVRVKAFELAEGQDASIVAKDVKQLQERLDKGGWTQLIKSVSGEETVIVSTMYNKGGEMVGLVVLNYENGKSATFVNVVGNLDLATLMKLAGEMHGDQLKGMMSNMHGEGGHDAPVKSERTE